MTVFKFLFVLALAVPLAVFIRKVSLAAGDLEDRSSRQEQRDLQGRRDLQGPADLTDR